MQQAPIIGMGRHRLAVDGRGVTTLVAFHGCPLRCRYCLNERCLRPEGVWRRVTTVELLQELRIDNLYFLATGGGVTFGGGEPCLRHAFIEEFCQMMPKEWNVVIESCLNVEREAVERLLPLVGQWIVDVKDMNPVIYKAYTGTDNQLTISNLRWLAEHDGMAQRITLRLPLIPHYNTPADILRSRRQLEDMGFANFDEFTYVLRHA